MPEATRTEARGEEPNEHSFQMTPPAIALPKGGGAIRWCRGESSATRSL